MRNDAAEKREYAPLPRALPGFEHINRYFDPIQKIASAKLMPGQFYVTVGDEILVTVLGSCIGLCLRDSSSGIGGMTHFLTPSRLSGPKTGAKSGELMVGREALDNLLAALVQHGARPTFLEAWLFGGGRIVKGLEDFGHANTVMTLNFCRDSRIRLRAQDTGGPHARKVYFRPRTGEVHAVILEQLPNDTIVQRDQVYIGGSIAARPLAANTPAGTNREFHMSDADFAEIVRLVREHSGIALADDKRELVYSRIARQVRALKLTRFEEYLTRLSGDPDEIPNLVNAITTNLTAFFRENHHFEYLVRTALPEIAERNHGKRCLRIWSAGCSTGEEPYSIAMVLAESAGLFAGWDAKVLATDIDTNVLAQAEAGVYRECGTAKMSRERMLKWFQRGAGAYRGSVRVTEIPRRFITFRQLNLLNPWPMSGPFDAIFCRNVVIYFDKTTQKMLFERFANMLAKRGYLFIGHSESLFQLSDRFDLIGQTIYRKKD